MNIDNPIARFTAAIILIVSLLAVTGVLGVINESGDKILTLMIGAAMTYLFVAQKKRVDVTG